jgi:hypothetical protein
VRRWATARDCLLPVEFAGYSLQTGGLLGWDRGSRWEVDLDVDADLVLDHDLDLDFGVFAAVRRPIGP